MQPQCISVESFVITLVFGYLLAAVVVVGTVVYYGRKNLQLEEKLKNISEDGHGTLLTMSTDISSINPGADSSSSRSGATVSTTVSGAGGSSPVPELHTGTDNVYDMIDDEIDTNAIRESAIYLEPVNE
ncbi:uncharacterized protein LOC117326678 [Pecten maximus]|uniref:uncharacterized protein LOC117326678 n=1 Tax=Pecten maximus TaxID=6579 RepID=UPI0014585F7C|nr:uncharacterized protein LOC117326678 [Pecten maximus]